MAMKIWLFTDAPVRLSLSPARGRSVTAEATIGETISRTAIRGPLPPRSRAGRGPWSPRRERDLASPLTDARQILWASMALGPMNSVVLVSKTGIEELPAILVARA